MRTVLKGHYKKTKNTRNIKNVKNVKNAIHEKMRLITALSRKLGKRLKTHHPRTDQGDPERRIPGG